VKPSDIQPIPRKKETQSKDQGDRRPPTLHLTSPEGMKWSKGKKKAADEKAAKLAAKAEAPPKVTKPKRKPVDFCPPYTPAKIVYCGVCNRAAVLKSKVRWVRCPKCFEPMHRNCAALPDTFCVCGETLYVL
jgi:hypothetical protein